MIRFILVDVSEVSYRKLLAANTLDTNFAGYPIEYCVLIGSSTSEFLGVSYPIELVKAPDSVHSMGV